MRYGLEEILVSRLSIPAQYLIRSRIGRERRAIRGVSRSIFFRKRSNSTCDRGGTAQRVIDRLLARDIAVARRLVQQKDSRPPLERSGNQYTLLLSDAVSKVAIGAVIGRGRFAAGIAAMAAGCLLAAGMALALTLAAALWVGCLAGALPGTALMPGNQSPNSRLAKVAADQGLTMRELEAHPDCDLCSKRAKARGAASNERGRLEQA
jgi:hypothetical protein